jgi:hypothetical protein
MMNKKQILGRIAFILDHRYVCNKEWFVDELKILVDSADSPEKFGLKGEILD